MKESTSPLTNPLILDLLGIILLLVFAFMSPPLGSDPGIGWHLKTGQWLSNHAAFIYHDPFLWTTEGKAWISNQWLGDLIFWAIFQLGDWDALALFCFSLPLTVIIYSQGQIFWGLLQGARAFNPNKNLLLSLFFKCLPFFFLAISLLVAWVQWIIRPVIFSFALFAIVFYLVWDYLRQDSPSKISILIKFALIFALWANLHSAFPLGLGILSAVCVGSLLDKKYEQSKFFAFLTFSSILASTINPYGLNLHKNIFELLGNSYFMNLNAEWQSPDFSEILFAPFLIGTLLLVLVFLRTGSLPTWIALVVLGLTALSLQSVRYISFLGAVMPTAFGYLLAAKRGAVALPFKCYQPRFFLFVLFGLLAVSFVPKAIDASKFSSDLINQDRLWFKMSEICSSSGTKIINHPNYGGAIAFKLYPQCRGSLDDRNELNGEAAYRNFFAAIREPQLFAKDNFSALYLIPCSSVKESEWDGLSVAFEKFGDVCLGLRG